MSDTRSLSEIALRHLCQIDLLLLPFPNGLKGGNYPEPPAPVLKQVDDCVTEIEKSFLMALDDRAEMMIIAPMLRSAYLLLDRSAKEFYGGVGEYQRTQARIIESMQRLMGYLPIQEGR